MSPEEDHSIEHLHLLEALENGAGKRVCAQGFHPDPSELLSGCFLWLLKPSFVHGNMACAIPSGLCSEK